MPYYKGKYVSNEVWTATFAPIQQLHTGPGGENPASAPVIDPETGTVKSTKKQTRSQRSEKAVKAAIADAMGVSPDSAVLADLDVSGLDDEFNGNLVDERLSPDAEEQLPEVAVTNVDNDPLACDQCDMVAKSVLGLASHKRAKHKEA